eukprot:TRINITY_DN26089_c0_g1_i1.p1 TRINITY_DN26089_c0_g1~~TRINITY_DN26089_c0_g1_i1.p1  ORF type:complete len:463 (-),score=50.54 TRINITY_DN26089_c0_g1_i1:232-1533(-)
MTSMRRQGLVFPRIGLNPSAKEAFGGEEGCLPDAQKLTACHSRLSFPSTACPSDDLTCVSDSMTDMLYPLNQDSLEASALLSDLAELGVAKTASAMSVDIGPSVSHRISPDEDSNASDAEHPDEPEVPRCPWRRGELIGQGTYGRVYLAQHRADGKIFAVKVARMRPNEDGGQEGYENLKRELHIIEGLCHPNVVRCLGHEYYNGSLEICMEYLPGGSLRALVDSFGALQGELLPHASRQLLEGLSYLHEQSPPVVHRDLKGANVLVGLDFCLKLADFGCAKQAKGGTKSLTSMGTPQWVAPEVFHHSDGHGRKADIWSFGCVVLEMVKASDPWGEDAFDNVMHAIRTIAFTEDLPPIPEDLLPEGSDLVRRCLERSPELRPTARELLRHGLVRRIKGKAASCRPHELASAKLAAWAAAAGVGAWRFGQWYWQ